MQDKDIREKLNQELDEMAPDILNKILATPIEPVKNEKELFGKNKPLFKKDKKGKKFIWIPVVTAVLAACIIMAIFLMPSMNNIKGPQVNMAFNIIIDVNPSIQIKVNADGTVKKLKASNKDAKEIVEKVNEKIGKNTDYNKVVQLVVKQLNRKGYLKTKKNAMLLSVVSEEKESGKKILKRIKEETKQYTEDKDIKCTAVYQNCVIDEKIIKVAEKNNVSVGKAAFCIKIAEKEKISVSEMCKNDIETLVKQAEISGVTTDEEVIIDDDILYNEGEIETVTETESMFLETESISETETIEESSKTEETTTIFVPEETQTLPEEVSIQETTTMIP